MNGAQIHLGINHFPVILCYTALVMLIISMLTKNDILVKTSFYVFIASGLFGVMAYFSGGGAAGVIKDLPGLTKGTIKEHALAANFALLSCGLTALASLIGLIYYYRAPKTFRIIVLILSLWTASVLARVAHLGGLIRHPEIENELGLRPIQNVLNSTKTGILV